MSRGGRRTLFAIALVLLAVPAFADTAAGLLSVGKKAFADGEYSLALRSFQRITAEFPESAGSPPMPSTRSLPFGPTIPDRVS